MRRSSLEGDTLGTTRGIVGGPHCIPAGSPAISDRQKKAILLQSAEEIRKVFLRAEADKVAHTKIRVEDWVRDSPRHFAACRNDGSLIVLASDLALLPAKTFAAIIAHEFGHATDFSYPGSFLLSNKGELVVRPQGRRSNQSVSRDVLERWESRSSDEVETTADRIAERIMGIHIGYCGPCNLQTMLTGSPDEASCHTSRPRGLRLDIMSYETKPSYTVSNQAELSQLVPDSDEGSTAYCVLEKTYWQLSLTSVQTLSPSCLATKSGTGRWVLAGPIAPASLPAPRVRLLLGSVHNGLTRTGNNIVCDGVIKLGTDGLREDLLSNLSYKTQIELLRYVPNRSKRVQQPSPSYAKMYGGFYHPSMPGSGSGGTRGGLHQWSIRFKANRVGCRRIFDRPRHRSECRRRACSLLRDREVPRQLGKLFAFGSLLDRQKEAFSVRSPFLCSKSTEGHLRLQVCVLGLCFSEVGLRTDEPDHHRQAVEVACRTDLLLP
jgi:hypothetical protein